MNSTKKKQLTVLRSLLNKAGSTSFGRQHDFRNIQNYAQFADHITIQDYRDVQPYINELKEGDSDILWPGRIQNFAVSAGTSGRGKHLPISEERLQSDRRFMRKVAVSYLKQRPNIFTIAGSHLSMPGSVDQKESFRIGEISGFTAQNAPAWLRSFQIVDPDKLTQLPFQQKFELLLKKALNSNLKVITAVPSWILTLFQQTLQKTGKESIAEIWPNLRLLVCGGVKLSNYRPHLEKLSTGLSLDFIETYGASEGYIGFSDSLEKNDLKMVTDNGLFFECIPATSIDEPQLHKPIPLWKVKKNTSYKLLLSTNVGLWRYALNDIIEFTSLNPLRFVVKGRENNMLDDFGEALTISEARKALTEVAKRMDNKITTFAISPVLKDEYHIPFHRWFVQLLDPANDDELKKIAEQVDLCLQKINRHYAIRRKSDALGLPEMHNISHADINHWLKHNNKSLAQGKLPRILPKNTNTLF